MNGKILSAILISTTLGAAIGFGASYLMLLSPIQNLQDELLRAQSDVSNMNSEIDNIKIDLYKAKDDWYFFPYQFAPQGHVVKRFRIARHPSRATGPVARSFFNI